MIVGRESELRFLNAAFERMLEGGGSVLFLSGEAGLGKTTLVHSWRDEGRGMRDEDKSLIPRASSLFLESACSIPIGNVDVGRLEALQPWADLIAQLHTIGVQTDGITLPHHAESHVNLRKLAADSVSSWALAVPLVGGIAHAAIETTRLVKEQHEHHKNINVKQLIADAAPAWAWALPVVGEVLHAAAETVRLAHEQKKGVGDQHFNAQNQQQVFQQYVNLLTKISTENPLVIFLDDLHWADASSCNLLFYLARQIADKRILVIGTYRRDEAVTADNGKGHPILTVKNEILSYEVGKELDLSALTMEAIHELLRLSFPSRDETLSLHDATQLEVWLHRISGGNSLFVTQYVKTLREDGMLTERGEFTGNFETVRVPPTALAVVMERTRRMDEGLRKMLMYATAEGEEFTAYVLEQVANRNPLELLDELQRATQLGLITQRGPSRIFANQTTELFGFSHALFHKALYDQLIDAQKIFLHRHCFLLLRGEWDRRAHLDQRSTTLATKLLTHAEKCGEWETIATVALDAAQEFWTSFNEVESLGMLGRVHFAAQQSPNATHQNAEAFYLEGRIHLLRARYFDAVDALHVAESQFQALDDRNRVVDTLNGLGDCYRWTGEFDLTMDACRRALAEATAIHFARGEFAALNTIGIVHYSQGRLAEALEFHSRALAIQETIDDQVGKASVLNNIGNVYYSEGRYTEAPSYYEKSLSINEDIGDRVGVATLLNNIGLVYNMQHRYVEAMESHERSLTIQQSIGNRSGVAASLNNIGHVHNFQARYTEAMRYFREGLEIKEAIGERAGVALGLNNIGIVHHKLGRDEEALEHYVKSMEIKESIGDDAGVGEALNNIGNAQLALRRYPEAVESHEKSLAISDSLGSLLDQAYALLGAAIARRGTGDFDVAAGHIQRALSISRELNATAIHGDCLCERVLIAEAESARLSGDARREKIRDVTSYCDTALAYLAELPRTNETETRSAELIQLRNRL